MSIFKSGKLERVRFLSKTTALILAAAFVTACASAPPSTPLPTGVPAIPSVTVSAPASLSPTVSPTTVPPAPTAQSATATNPLPTVTPTSLPPVPTTAPSTAEVEAETNQDNPNVMEANSMNIQIGDNVLTATLVENSSVDALKEALSEGPITVNMRDYESMEKVGSLGMDLPRNDQQITTEAGDIILYQGSAFVIYYAPNSWNFTRLGKIDNVTAEELREILGDGNVTVTLSLPQE
jgi:hypothetical protein